MLLGLPHGANQSDLNDDKGPSENRLNGDNDIFKYAGETAPVYSTGD